MKKLLLLMFALVLSLWTIGQTLQTQSWDGTFPPTGWVITNAGSGNNWVKTTSGMYAGAGCMAYSYETTSTYAANTWAFAPAVTLTAGTTYTIKFYQKIASASWPEKLKVTIGNGQNVAAQTTTLWDCAGGANLTNATYIARTVSFTPPAGTGTYNVAFNCYSDADKDVLYVDEYSLFADVVPDSPPVSFTTSSVTGTSMTVGWTDNSTNETVFRVYRSTSPTSGFVQIGSDIASTTVAGTGNTYSQAQTGLAPGTTYYFRITAATDIYETGYLQGNFPTLSGLTINSIADGAWSTPGTWSSGIVPTNIDNVTIANNVNVDVSTAVCYNLTISSGKTLSCTGTTGVLTVGNDLTNNGILDFYVGATGTSTAGLVFTGVNSNSFSGTGTTTDLNSLTINKGTSNASVLEMNLSAFSVKNLSSAAVGFLTLTNGTLKISGTNTFTGAVFATTGYTIGATAGFWLNNPNFTVTGQNASSGTMSGLLHITQGTLNIGTAINQNMALATGSTVIMEGGAIKVAGRFGVSAAANTITYNQSGGTITACMVGYSTGTGSLYSFDLGTSLTGSINWTGGIVVLQKNSTSTTHRDYRCDAEVNDISGGTLQIGNAASGAAGTFNIFSNVPNLVIDPTYAHSVTFTLSTTTGQFYDNAYNVTIGAGTTLNIGPNLFLFQGTTFTNNGILVATGASTRFYFTNSVAQTYTGTGTATAPVTSLDLDNDVSVTFSNSNNMACARIDLFSGNVFGSSKLTLGNGGAVNNSIQIGGTTTPLTPGTFDVPLTFNVGTLGEIVYYLRTSSSRTTGGELPTTGRALYALTYDDNDPTHTLSIGGGNVSTSLLYLTNGIINTNSTNLLTVSGTTAASIIGGSATAYVNGPLALTLPASLVSGSTYVFPIGKSAEKPLELVNPTTTAGGLVVVKAEVFDANCGGTPGTGIASLNSNRYWNATITSGAANFTNTTVRLTESGLASNNIMAACATQSGTYNKISSTPPTTTTIISDAVTSLAYFAIGTSAVPVTGTLKGTVYDANSNPLPGATVSFSTYTTTSLSNGTYEFDNVFHGTYDVSCSEDGYITSTITGVIVTTSATTTQNFTLAYKLNKPLNVQGSVVNTNHAYITWLAPGTVVDQWIKWDNGVNADAIGTNATADFSVASRWPVSDLTPYAGSYLKKVRFYPNEASCTYTIQVWKGVSPPTLVYSQVVASPVIGAFNTVVLTPSTPILITGTEEFWFGYEANATTGYPAGCDAGPAVASKGNMIYWNSVWQQLTDLSATLTGNWNIAGFVGSDPSSLSPQQMLPMTQVANPLETPKTVSAVTSKRVPSQESATTLFTSARAQNVPLHVASSAVINANQNANIAAPLSTWTVIGYNVYRNGSTTPVNGTTLITDLFKDDGPLAGGTYTYYVTAVYPQGESAQAGPATVVITAPSTTTLNLKVYLESLYPDPLNPGKMRYAQGDAGNEFTGTTVDVITVELHLQADGSLIYTHDANLNDDGTASLEIPAENSGSYYIYIKHRNSIKTSTTTALSFATGPVNYDFTTAASMAFGDNQKDFGNGKFGIYAGDVDQDGGIGIYDMGLVENASNNFASGYLPEDVNGDGSVGIYDMGIIENNSNAFVGVSLPF